MKPVRLLLLGATVLLVVLVAAVVVGFNGRFQTWLVRRELAARQDLHATVDAVSVSLGRVQLRGLRVERQGAVLTVPALEVELPLLSAGLRNRVQITRLTAKGWTLDLTKAVKVGRLTGSPATRSAARSPRPFSFLTSAYAADATPTAATSGQLFQGVFAQLKLPVDLALDGVELAGDVILRPQTGQTTNRLHVALAGGGLEAGREGKFSLALDGEAAGSGGPVSSLALRATVSATMDTPRTFGGAGVKADASATGPAFPSGVKLTADLTAGHSGAVENYALTLATESKQLLTVQASYPNSASRLAGTWKLDVRDADVAPFALGMALPSFEASGEGRFDTDAAFGEIHAAGKLAAAVDRLAAVRPELAALGAVRFTSDFDLTQRGDATRIEHIAISFSGAKPVAVFQSLQAFAFNARTRELKADDPARELFNVALQGVPLAWMQPLLPKDLAVTGGDLRGEFAATARDGGFTLRSKAPLVAGNVSVAQPGRPLLRAVDLSATISADYTPKAWQAEVAPLTASSGQVVWLTLDAKAGQLTGTDQPIKAAGKFSANLPVALAQPAVSGVLALTRGDAIGEFAASLSATQSIQAKLALNHLVADPKLTAEILPTFGAEVRADIAADGAITLNAPLLIERNGRRSDLTVAGTFTPGNAGLALDARVSGALLVIDDAKALAAPLVPSPAPVTGTSAAKPVARDVAPPWAGASGQVTLDLKRVIYSDSFQAGDLAGTLRLDAGALRLDDVRANLGDGSEAKLAGGVTFDPKSIAPFGLVADLTINDFNPAPLFQALNPGQPATVEGKFTVASKLSASAATLGELAAGTRGDFQLTSKGGVFRGLPVSVAAKNENVGKLAAGVAFVGSAFDALKGRKDDSDVTSTAKAVTEVSKMFAAIRYDQLSVVLSRDAALNTILKDFTLIAPEMRITGGGQTAHQAGGTLLDETMAMEFKLRARGRTGELLKILGKLDGSVDELGYAACTLPLKVGGTLGKPDTSELNNALAGIAVEKSGMLDKAGGLLKGLIPGGK